MLGVFIVHFVAGAIYILPLDEAVRTRWLGEPGNGLALFLTEWLFRDKANTLFAVLFGMGFWVMLGRLRARRADFAAIYLRRLTILLFIGVVDVALIFPGDVLHEYALLRFLLIALRNLSANAMLAIGLPLFCFGTVLGTAIAGMADMSWEWMDVQQAQVFAAGGYLDWVRWHWPAHLRRDVLELGGLSWALHIFGRLLIGAWIVRQGWLTDIAVRLPTIRTLFRAALPLGLTLELAALLASSSPVLDTTVYYLLHGIGAPILAAAYALGLVLSFHGGGRALATAFAPVGRMALTIYLAQAALFTAIYFPFGFDLLGKLTPAGGLALAVASFTAFTIFARWWLARFRYGPLEYLWRWGTYGRAPAFRIQPA